jgi:hypothetical protein
VGQPLAGWEPRDEVCIRPALANSAFHASLSKVACPATTAVAASMCPPCLLSKACKPGWQQAWICPDPAVLRPCLTCPGLPNHSSAVPNEGGNFGTGARIQDLDGGKREGEMTEG